jgi:hypothetical protein
MGVELRSGGNIEDVQNKNKERIRNIKEDVKASRAVQQRIYQGLWKTPRWPHSFIACAVLRKRHAFRSGFNLFQFFAAA